MDQKIRKIIFVSYIIAPEFVAGNSHYYEDNTCPRQSLYQQ